MIDKEKITDALNNPGLWRGLVYIVMALGIPVAPEDANAIVAFGLAASGVIHVFWKDKKDEK